MKVLMTLLMIIFGGVAAAADSRESIEIAFDRNKGKLYAEYTRAWRENPRIEGKIVFQIDIGKTGDVTGCRVQSSELGDAGLERRLCERISAIKFGPRAAPITITKPVDFFPAR